MGKRSIRVSVTGLMLVNETLQKNGWTQEQLAGFAGCSRQTVSQFLGLKYISKTIFQDICHELRLEWATLAELESDNSTMSQSHYIDVLVQEVRSEFSVSIQKRCGMMRVLDMERPISIDSIYTSVNILEKVSRNQRFTAGELIEGVTKENFDRFGLSAIQKRLPGLQAVGENSKLLILGKPGSGKTTFLKSLAVQSMAGRIYQNRVPFFINLKEFAEARRSATFETFIGNQLEEYGIKNPHIKAIQLLQSGRAILLLDGLDEVRSEDQDRILDTIRRATEKFDANKFIMTCRISAKEYIFEQFTEVEIADFDIEQISDFAHKWFEFKDKIKGDEFATRLKVQSRLQELATNPLLLTLLCLVFETRGGFPPNRSKLYKEGLDILLRKWDESKKIIRDSLYTNLSLQQKKDLLKQIACRSFIVGKYFFDKEFIEKEVQHYLRNSPIILEFDVEYFLKSIEVQHGLLVERSRGIYSFSHLTFHEYFTAQQLLENFTDNFDNLLIHVSSLRYREVFLLVIENMDNANTLIQAMKHKVDMILLEDQILQDFLFYYKEKSISIITNHKLSAIREFYFSNVRAESVLYNLVSDLSIKISAMKKEEKDSTEKIIIAQKKETSLSQELILIRDKITTDKIEIQESERKFKLAKADTQMCKNRLDSAQSYIKEYNLTLNLARNIAHSLSLSLANDTNFIDNIKIDLAFLLTLDQSQALLLSDNLTELQQLLQQIWEKIPDYSSKERISSKKQLKTNSSQLAKELIGTDSKDIEQIWKFTKTQDQLLKKYYIANKLLVECLNSDSEISSEVREEIESTLLLPIASIEKYKQN